MQQVLGLLTVQLGVAQIHDDQVHVRTTGQHGHPVLGDIGGVQALGQDLGALNGAALALGEVLGRGDLERHGLAGDGVHERPALLAREHGGVDLLLELLGGQDHAGSGTRQGLVHGGGGHVRVGHGVGVQSRGHQTGEVCHVDPQFGVHFVRDGTESFEVQLARVRGPAGHDDFGSGLECGFAHLVHVDAVTVRIHLVRGNVVELAGHVDLHPVGQVTTVCQGQSHQGVTGLHERSHHCGVGLGTRVGLHVGVLGTEQLGGAIASQVLHHVHEFTTAVVATARITLGVLVGEHGALRLEDRTRCEILGGDHFQRGALPPQFLLDGP